MAQLAIKGHATRGKEVIKLLEMMGGKNVDSYKGNNASWYYFIRNDNIDWHHEYCPCEHFINFTIEEFLEKYPYKIGDKVSSKYLKNYKIEKMGWKDTNNRVTYKLQGMGWFSADDLQLCKEETMEETKPISPTTEINLNHPCFDAYNEIELIIPANWKFEQRGKEMFGVRKQYPKTYEECCKVLSLSEDGKLYTKGYKASLIQNFQKLFICRNAYWKMAGEEMGLGKAWEPDWNNNTEKYVIYPFQYVYSIDKENYRNTILAFPTKEMRNAFYENFKNLIDACKELL